MRRLSRAEPSPSLIMIGTPVFLAQKATVDGVAVKLKF